MWGNDDGRGCARAVASPDLTSIGRDAGCATGKTESISTKEELNG